MSCNGGCNEATESQSYSTEELHENFVPEKPTVEIGKNVDMAAVIGNGRIFKKYACNLIPLSVVAEALGRTPQEVTRRNATPRDADPAQTACFYKWSDFEVPNAGIFIQMLRNPLGDEYPDYMSKMIDSKKEVGEQGVGSEAMIFKTFEGFGDDGAYSTEAAKYYWRLGEDIVFHIAFNTAHGPNDQYKAASIIAKAMTEEYLKS